MKVVVIGGVAGGATAAARLRRLDEHAEIVIFERTGFVSYANCGLPYYVSGVIHDKKKLTLQSPESFRKRFNIDVYVRHEVTKIDRSKKIVQVTRLDDGSSFEESYDKLILSPGARSARPPFSGMESKRIFTLRTVEDTYKIKDYVDELEHGHAVVIGAGFIGLEMVESFVERGFKVSILQRSKQVMPPLDYDMATFVHSFLRSKGVELRFGQNVTGFVDTDDGISVTFKDGPSLDADIVLLATGVKPDSHLAQEAGLEMGDGGSIKVDAHMRTSDPSIFAAGDAIEFPHFVSGQSGITALAGPANKQGRIIADNICGIPSKFAGAQGSSVLKLFDLVVATTGINEKTAQAAGISYDRVVTVGPSHATYYPGSARITMKTLFEKGTGRILGAQIIGLDGVDKRIDVIATAIRAGMNGSALGELDLAYAPPFSSAKDPVNVAGLIIENVLNGIVTQVHWDELEELKKSGIQLVDVSTEREFQNRCIEGFVNIPLFELRDRIDEIDTETPVCFICFSGSRSYVACRIAAGHGITAYNFSGGYHFYEQVLKGLALDTDAE